MNRRTRYYVTAAIMQAALCISGFAVPLLARHIFHASARTLGLLAATGMATYVLCSLAAGRISDRIGRRVVMVLGVLVNCAATAMMGFCPSLGLLFLLVVLWNIGQGMFWPPLEAAIADDAPRHLLPIRVGIFNIAWCSSVMVGTWLGGRFYDSNVRLPFAWAVIAGMCVVPIILSATPGRRPTPAADVPDDPTPAPEAGPDCRRLFLYMAWGANFLAGGLYSTIRAFFAPDVTMRLGYSGQQAAILVGAVQVTQVIVFALLTFFHGWRYRFWFFASAQAVMLAGAAGLALSNSALPLALSFFAVGLGEGVVYTSSIYYSLDSLHDRGAKSGLHEAFAATGAAIAPMIGGWLATAIGDMRAPYALCAGLIAIGLAWQGWMYFSALGRAPAKEAANAE